MCAPRARSPRSSAPSAPKGPAPISDVASGYGRALHLSGRPPNDLIRPVDTTLLDAVAKTAPTVPAQSGAAEATGKNAFAAQLKRAAEDTTTETAADAKPAAADGRTAARTTVMPDGEKWRPVKGHDDYAEIIAGDRKGQMINLNRG